MNHFVAEVGASPHASHKIGFRAHLSVVGVELKRGAEQVIQYWSFSKRSLAIWMSGNFFNGTLAVNGLAASVAEQRPRPRAELCSFIVAEYRALLA
ncbi:predicted protein [Pyrenophora tritici-repentis Pt-1C-BFP]|uniref:Uncharacterized protein n=1 Tax=Pyrenophora tritici-repentis (strain Pt-1C-BFP) TaxID=426418 RepID=B2W961_PYRTR|nr:uncharacterized protein PTRG_06519 [Pyrenophora tritici-repentis Pt-1C-BFP]EDU49439.1 predicted protein [Pyrenophora tritici-repentis Pt-1C-BFP]